MGARIWSIEGELPTSRRNKRLNDILRSKRSEAHEPKQGPSIKRSRRRAIDRQRIAEAMDDY